MKRTLAIIGAVVLIAVAIPSEHSSGEMALEPTPSKCVTNTRALMAKETRLLRSVVYGQRPSDEAREGSVRADRESNLWTKVGDNTWKTLAQGFENTTWSDLQMDSQGEEENRRGIFDITHALTSELIPPITQSARAFRCRLENICLAASLSEGAKGDTVTAQAPGCLPQTFAKITACTTAANEGLVTLAQGLILCRNDATELLIRETDLLRAAVAYDASYRSLLQFTGKFDSFLLQVDTNVIPLLRDAVGMLQKLGSLPCFLSECND